MELSEEVKKFLFPGDEDVAMFSHRTVSREIADKIIENEYKYRESDKFSKTSLSHITCYVIKKLFLMINDAIISKYFS